MSRGQYDLVRAAANSGRTRTGPELNVLFADEGFGSPDEELIRVAIGMLKNRRVADMIRHVAEPP